MTTFTIFALLVLYFEFRLKHDVKWLEHRLDNHRDHINDINRTLHYPVVRPKKRKKKAATRTQVSAEASTNNIVAGPWK